jgi:hypothetical protein
LSVKKFPSYLGNILHNRQRELPLLLPHAEQNDAAPGIRERTVGPPKIFRQSPFTVASRRKLELQVNKLAKQLNVSDGVEVDHESFWPGTRP